MRKLIALTALAGLVLAAAPAHAERIIRDPAQISSMPIQGVTLSMTPEQAFNHLTSLGYRSQGIPTYADWTTGGISMVLGDFSAPEGRSEVTLSRTRSNDRLVNISETFNRPRQRFDTAAEMSAMQAHFSIGADEPDCRMGAGGGGTCRVAESEENTNHVYGLTALPTMLMRYATRNHELKDSY